MKVYFVGAGPGAADLITLRGARLLGQVKMVLYAGSLVNLMTKQIGPAFQKASGYSVTGESAGSTALVTDIIEVLRGSSRAPDDERCHRAAGTGGTS